MLNKEHREFKTNDFDSLKITVASPENILDWSHGEVTKPETINYRTQKPERDGLFDERIFGPTKDYECYCGKYKKIRYKGIVCDKCGVEVTRSSVRRERMGHIDLSVPVAHIWYIRGVPSALGSILDLSVNELERVVYFGSYLILEVNEPVRTSVLEQLEQEYKEEKSKNRVSPELEANYRQIKHEISSLAPKKLISEEKYHELSLKYGNIVKVGIGAEALAQLLERIKLDQETKALLTLINQSQGANKRRLLRRLRLLSNMKAAGILPQWLLMYRIPVLPPDLRPMVQLDGGRFAASDLNDLYRRVINRNNRLKRLLAQGAPEVITRNEKRMLQEAVDALIDNSARKTRAVTTGAGNRKLRSLSDMLRGKQGRFRQNLLGKRVDYSGRSVIVVGPNLKLHQCGLPKVIALELFKPFVISKLVAEGYVHNVKNASRLIERGEPEVWDILERITSNSYVLLNRAPTLHRLGIQTFQPVLVEGKAIQIHPLVCLAFNADFDGDQMAVHLPLSEQAVDEAKNIMLSSKNLLKPASGEPVVQPRYDIVFGCYYLTTFKAGSLGEGKVFASPDEAINAHRLDLLHVRAKIKVKIPASTAGGADGIVETSVGRLLFNQILPEGWPFVNTPQNNKSLKELVLEVYRQCGTQETAELADRIKTLGFDYATVSGLTIAMADLYVPEGKAELLAEGEKQIDNIESQYQKGLITEQERDFKIIETWTVVRSSIEKKMVEGFDKESPVYLMVASGARGSFAQIIQMSGMKGLVVNPAGEIITVPVKANFKEGLDVYEYFISTHGARKGKSDTSLRTSDAGYLTRRLVDVAQDIVIHEQDCGTKDHITITRNESKSLGQKFASRIFGRSAAAAVVDPATKKTLVKTNGLIDQHVAKTIDESTVETVKVRSPLTCTADRGVCQLCYALDLASGTLVNIGESVGIMAAQAIGEPGTQLTMKTFHLGGVSGEDITTGLPRVEELFEVRPPKRPAILSEIAGKVTVEQAGDQIKIAVSSVSPAKRIITVPAGLKIAIKDRQTIRARQPLYSLSDGMIIRSEIGGVAEVKDQTIVIAGKEKEMLEYFLPATAQLLVHDTDEITAGAPLNEGYIDLSEALRLQGREAAQKYVVSEIQKIYQSQGQEINDRHLEIIVRQMFSRVKIVDGGDTNLLPGQIIERLAAQQLSEKMKSQGKKIPTYQNIILGITRVALKTDSFLSAASFQETTSILIDAALQGKEDDLKGLKENVIIGKLIPAGTGYRKI
ncbi:DNA-directed RNA polymerase subunit beta' [Candidatus Berkelbacteria bacterium]|nr:DNA-directed RNA polymerase subunit beta' [Candidatus Berkelbacteria bacterium]